MRFTSTLAADGADKNSGTFRPTRGHSGAVDVYALVQVEIVGGATVKLMGRRAADLTWRELHSWAAAAESGLYGVALAPEMRIEITGNTGSVTVDMEGVLA